MLIRWVRGLERVGIESTQVLRLCVNNGITKSSRIEIFNQGLYTNELQKLYKLENLYKRSAHWPSNC
jgi:hypothetical protein